MSSITAAPRMIWPSGSCSRPRSDSTRAVIPTLVAVRVAPAMIETSVDSPSSTASGEPQRERQDHTHDGHRQRRRADLHELAQIGLQPDREQQDHHSQLREEMDRLVIRIHQPSTDLPDQHAADQLAQNRRLAQSAAPGSPRPWPRPA